VGGRTARQLDALLVRQDAIAEAQMKEVAHEQTPFIHLDQQVRIGSVPGDEY
jgi:hypothetical protein